MKKFIVLYFLFLALLFTSLYANTSGFSNMINEGQTQLTLYFLNLFLEPNQLKGIDIWINPHYKIIINQACNGMIPILFLWASILAYPSTIWHKTVWIVLGYFIFSLVNVFRILLVVYFAEQKAGQANFYWSHDLLGNSMLMIVGLGLFIGFIKTTRKVRNLRQNNL
jgi:exosortase/archaeosortase family protein